MTSNREETHAPSDSVMKQMALNILEVLTPMKGHYLVKKKKKECIVLRTGARIHSSYGKKNLAGGEGGGGLDALEAYGRRMSENFLFAKVSFPRSSLTRWTTQLIG